jgi:hypothetical protein
MYVTLYMGHPVCTVTITSKFFVSLFRYSDYRDTVLSLMDDVTRLKFHGVIPGAPVGIGRNTAAAKKPKPCSDEMSTCTKTKNNDEQVLVTPL